MRIRRIYVPELIIRIHAMLTASRSKIPESVSHLICRPKDHSLSDLTSSTSLSHTFFYHRNLKHALELVNVVADSRYKLYDDFSGEDGRRLGDYLSAVRQAVLCGLEGGGSDPFRVVTL